MRGLVLSFIVFLTQPLLAEGLCDHYGNLSNILTIHRPLEPMPTSLASRTRLLVWNIHKGDDPQLISDFKKISQFADIVLFQEFISAGTFTSQLIQANPSLAWSLSKAFIWMDGSYTGVANGSRVRPLCEFGVKSPVTEPLIDSPKTILLSEYSVAGLAEHLLVANIHAINFVTNSTFEVHMNQLLALISKHRGPMIVAGDFNTWNDFRLSYLLRKMNSLGLSKIQIPSSQWLTLDHIFTRGVLKTQWTNLSNIESSDHEPLLVDLIFGK